MSFKQIIKKVSSIDLKNTRLGKGITPAEKELNSYLERDRQDKIKKQVQRFRDQDTKELLTGNLMKKQRQILSKENIFKSRNKKQKNIMKGKNILNIKGGIL